jgi:hypothetical protein
MSYIEQFKDNLIDCLTFTSLIPESHIQYMYEGHPDIEGNSLKINLRGIDPKGRYQSTLTDNDRYLQVINEYQARVQLLFCGPNCAELSTEFSNNLTHVKFWEEWGSKKLSIIQRRPALPLPEKRSDKWVQRYSIDLTIGFSATSLVEIDVIEKVVITDLNGKQIIFS